MGYSWQGPSGLGLEANNPAGLHHETYPKTGMRLQPVSFSSLAAVELPLLAIVFLITVISIAVAPDSTLRNSGLTLPSLWCPFYELTHIPCLFCGLTRSFMAAGGLDLKQSFIFHPLGPIYYAAMLITGATTAASIISRQRIIVTFDNRLRRNLITSGAGIIVGAWFLKLFAWNSAGLL